MCGDVVETMEFIRVRATYEYEGWSVVVVTPSGSGVRAATLLVALDLHVLAPDLWDAIVAAAAPIGIALPPTPADPPRSPGAGVREWHLPRATLSPRATAALRRSAAPRRR